MLETIMEQSGKAEVLLRKMATVAKPIKKKLRKAIKGNLKSEIAIQRNDEKIALLRNKLQNCGIKEGDIVLVHSSLDGLRSLGISTEELIDFILNVFEHNTVVFATYPIEPLRKKEVYNDKYIRCAENGSTATNHESYGGEK